ncbi:zinc metalloproteinase-disintegrin-like VLAIP-A [Hydractinia symbiolongicarpus]|uniref:zinc metalloproteinase-disintegrin-like VLAIP-A n=1 Tax=Hydractinia symbiolongicarpus TaxID=13093 RepID=UPI00254B0894|nr:zinc metalloproteinase-disintegrin-like VLAIP-A [Hydractinia symbiolongicarpus]
MSALDITMYMIFTHISHAGQTSRSTNIGYDHTLCKPRGTNLGYVHTLCKSREYPALSDLRAYDIVEPIVVSKSGKHHRWRRAVQKHVNGEDLEFILHTKLKKYHLFLQLNRRLVHPDFTLTYQTRNGKNKVEKPILKKCHYHGRLLETNSRAAISICEGGLSYMLEISSFAFSSLYKIVCICFSGRIVTSTGENVFIEPLNDKHGRHIVFKSKDVKTNKAMKIDMLSRMVPQKLKNNIRFRRNIDGNFLVNQTKYITIAFVADKTYYTSQGSMEKSVTKIMKIINHMDFVSSLNMSVLLHRSQRKIYRTINVRIAIISLDIWNIRNVITITNITSSNLNIFNKYNLAELVINRQGKHDNAQLLT